MLSGKYGQDSLKRLKVKVTKSTYRCHSRTKFKGRNCTNAKIIMTVRRVGYNVSIMSEFWGSVVSKGT